MHIHLLINGNSLMLSDAYPEHGYPIGKAGGALTLHLQVDDVDKWFERATAAGCEVTLPVQLMFWGDRYGQLKDPTASRGRSPRRPRPKAHDNKEGTACSPKKIGNMRQIIGIVVVVAIVALLGYAATKPNHFRIARSTVIKAPPERIYALIEDFHKWGLWSPYEKLDPAMSRTYGGSGQRPGLDLCLERRRQGRGRADGDHRGGRAVQSW